MLMNRSFGRQVVAPIAALAAMALWAPSAHAAGPSDGMITTKTKLALYTTDHVNGTKIHVDTNNATVFLYGKASDQLEKDRAGEVARGIGGVRDVRNLIQVVPPGSDQVVQVSDDHLKADLKRAFDGSVDKHISVKAVDNGVVLLSGKAEDLSQILWAVQVASGVPGVRRVASEVKSPDRVAALDTTAPVATAKSPAARTHNGGKDSWITADTKMRLIADPAVPAMDIGVDTYHGVVTLFGSVSSSDAKAAAIADARKVTATVQVNDEIEVVSDNRKAVLAANDGDIKNNVQSGLKNDDDYKHVSVDVKNGVVHLTGVVPSGWARMNALTVARTAVGTRAVYDDLHVSPSRS